VYVCMCMNTFDADPWTVKHRDLWQLLYYTRRLTPVLFYIYIRYRNNSSYCDIKHSV